MDFSKLKIETERLIIRPYRNSDYPNWYNQYNNRLSPQYKYDDGRPANMPNFTKRWFSKWIAGFRKSAKNDEMYILGIFRKEDGVNVGKVELIKILRMEYDWAMMGYFIHNQFWKNGYGRESVKAASDAFFKRLDFHRIELHIHPDNEPSIRLAENTGFIFECKRKEFSRENGQWKDLLIYYKNRP